MAAPKGNKFALGLTTSGRPPIYKPDKEGFEAIKSKCIEYFECEEKATITGLALFLGFSCRDTLYDYAKNKEFSDIIKRAMLTVENSYETSATTFDMFALKNMGWIDKREIDNKSSDGSMATKPNITVTSGKAKAVLNEILKNGSTDNECI